MSEENTTIGPDTQRRRFLQAASSVGAVGPFLSVPVDAGEPRVNSIRLVEVGVECSLPLLEKPNTRYKIHHWENPPKYLVDRSARQVAVYHRASGAERRRVMNGEKVVNRKEIREAPTNHFVQPTDKLQSNTGANLNANYTILLDGTHDFPTVSVRPKKRETEIQGDGIDATVEKRSTRTIDLPEQTISVKTVTSGDRIENPDVPPHLRGVELTESSTTVTVAPSLVVRDRGRLDVYDRTDRSV